MLLLLLLLLVCYCIDGWLLCAYSRSFSFKCTSSGVGAMEEYNRAPRSWVGLIVPSYVSVTAGVDVDQGIIDLDIVSA